MGEETKLGQAFLKRVVGALDMKGARVVTKDAAEAFRKTSMDTLDGLTGKANLSDVEKGVADGLLKKHHIKVKDGDYQSAFDTLGDKLTDPKRGKSIIDKIGNKASITGNWLTAADRAEPGAGSRAKAIAVRGGTVAGATFLGAETLNGIGHTLSGNRNSDIGGRPY